MNPEIDVSGLFGMYEMERAAAHLIRKIASRQDWNTGICYEDFKDPHPPSPNHPKPFVDVILNCYIDNIERTGFLQLLYYQWLRPTPVTSKRYFGPRQNFVDRVLPRVLRAYGADVDTWKPITPGR